MARMVEQEPLLMMTSLSTSTSSVLGRRHVGPSIRQGALVLLVAVSLLAWGCGDSTSIPNALPSVAGVDSITCADGVCDLWLRVVDPDMDGVDLRIDCLLDGDQPCTVEDAPGTDGRYGLLPDREPPGRDHLLRLIPSVDDTSVTIRLRFTPTDLPGDEGTAFTTPGFTLAEGL
jgi:hypothetical protein